MNNKLGYFRSSAVKNKIVLSKITNIVVGTHVLGMYVCKSYFEVGKNVCQGR